MFVFNKVEVVTWKTKHTVVIDNDAIRLLCFRANDTGDNVLILPPQAGHHSYIADYKEGQSLVQSALESTTKGVYAIEWKSATYTRRNESITDLLGQVGDCVTALGGSAHIVGLCQGGWLASIYAAMNPNAARSLTIAGAPINTHAGDSVLKPAIHDVPMVMYRQVVAMGGGMMRGDIMLANWKAFNTQTHFIDRYLSPNENTEEFYGWYDMTQNIAGNWYLWCIENIFKGNGLGLNSLTIDGNPVDLRRIKCPVNVVCGEHDDITPPAQTMALLDYCDGKSWMIDGAGHVGVFMGRKGIESVWSKLFAQL